MFFIEFVVMVLVFMDLLDQDNNDIGLQQDGDSRSQGNTGTSNDWTNSGSSSSGQAGTTNTVGQLFKEPDLSPPSVLPLEEGDDSNGQSTGLSLPLTTPSAIQSPFSGSFPPELSSLPGSTEAPKDTDQQEELGNIFGGSTGNSDDEQNFEELLELPSGDSDFQGSSSDQEEDDSGFSLTLDETGTSDGEDSTNPDASLEGQLSSYQGSSIFGNLQNLQVADPAQVSQTSSTESVEQSSLGTTPREENSVANGLSFDNLGLTQSTKPPGQTQTNGATSRNYPYSQHFGRFNPFRAFRLLYIDGGFKIRRRSISDRRRILTS